MPTLFRELIWVNLDGKEKVEIIHGILTSYSVWVTLQPGPAVLAEGLSGSPPTVGCGTGPALLQAPVAVPSYICCWGHRDRVSVAVCERSCE